MLIYNAKLWGKEELQGIYIENEKIIEISESQKLLHKYKDVTTYDAQGKRVIPGLNDSHLHLIAYANLKKNLRLENAKSIKEVISLGKKYLKDRPNSKIMIGNMYNDNNFIEKRNLTRFDLDEISKDIPIICYRVCLHICTINSKAIELLNLDVNTKVPGGSIDFKDGELTGVIRENAMDLLKPLTEREYSKEEYKDLIIEGIKDANEVGLTSLQTNDIHNDILDAKKIYSAYIDLAKEGKLNARINHQITFEDVNILDKFLNYVNFENDYLKTGPLKLFVDGSLGARTAAVFDNYLNDDQNGIICISRDNLESLINYMNKKNKPVIVHAIGDRGISLVLDEFEKVNKYNNLSRNGIVHVQITSKELLKRFEELQICALVQPIFINTDMFMVYDRVSRDLADSSYAFKTLFNTTKTGFGSDSPVESFNPFLGLYHAVTRMDLSENNTYILEEALSIEDAIKAYSETGAYMSFEENKKGKIDVGYLADLLILDEDIYEIDSLRIKDIKVNCTMVGGRIVYEK